LSDPENFFRSNRLFSLGDPDFPQGVFGLIKGFPDRMKSGNKAVVILPLCFSSRFPGLVWDVFSAFTG
jgi:hypothetical protein